MAFLQGVLRPELFDRLARTVLAAAEFHDLGKLDDANQSVLRGETKAKSLPVVHSDAGVVATRDSSFMVALLIASHHVGLPDFTDLANQRQDELLRADVPVSMRMRNNLQCLLSRHEEACGESPFPVLPSAFPDGVDLPTFCRQALSLLVDADHTDSSAPNRPLEEIRSEQTVCLLPAERLAALDAFVAGYSKSGERNALRADLYQECRTSCISENIVACDSPVGSGKTTAVMAYLLLTARKRGLRRIFVILPFTNIISKSVKTYRKALVLPGEDPEKVVAEVHHLVDFDGDASRNYATMWNAPVVVTTAVAFFETMASAHPSALRRLHELPGSAVFVDEAHAALPARFFPVTWKWMLSYAADWNVHWVLASGSLVRFWELDVVRRAIRNACGASDVSVPALSTPLLRHRASAYDKARVAFRTMGNDVSVDGLAEAVCLSQGPRVVILNTVQNAAIVADTFRKSGKFDAVFHLSTALAPVDRDEALSAVLERLKSDRHGNWVLVGTSCIEAGMDFDFANGFREMASLASLVQASGRVNRNGERIGSAIYSFKLGPDKRLNKNRSIEDSVRVMERLLKRGAEIGSDLCTDALRMELTLDPAAADSYSRMVEAEMRLDFKDVARRYKIITADTRTVITSREIVDRLESHAHVDWRDIQRSSVKIWGYRLEDLRIPEVSGCPGLYKWTLEYDEFLGYMAGVVKLEAVLSNGGVI